VRGEREVLCGCAHEPGARAHLVDARLEPSEHRLLGLGDREAANVLAVEREVGTGAAADLDHVARRAREQRPAMRLEGVPLTRREQAVIASREDLAPEYHFPIPRLGSACRVDDTPVGRGRASPAAKTDSGGAAFAAGAPARCV